MQFAIGGLFGKYLIFYGRSGTVLGSWPFLLLLVVLTVLNEYWRDRYKRLDFRLALLFVGLLGYTVFALPILTKTLGAWTFVASGFIALFVMALVLALVRQVAHDVTHREWWRLYMIVAGIFVVMNGLYFTNTIPPIPLALKEIGVYHSVERVGDTYIALGEDEPWYKPGTTYHKQAGEGVAVFAAVFAPSALKTTIIHRWEHKQNGAWQERARIPIAIAGGRDGGYRGYSRLGNPSPGPWRVSVLTLRGQVLGRLTFEVVEAEANLPLIEERL